jgi:uncharacterized protein
MQKLIIPAEFKDSGEGTFTGYGNVMNVVDAYGERTVPGAFRDDLLTRGPRRPLLWSHNPAEPIGTVDLVEDQHGLRVTKGQLVLDVQRAKEAYALLKTPGALGGMSIGFESLKKRTASDGSTELLSIKIWEVSLVCFPANAASIVDSVKRSDADEDDIAVQRLTCNLRMLRVSTAIAYNKRRQEQLQRDIAHTEARLARLERRIA